MTPGEFVKLMKEGSWRDAPESETLVEDRSVVQELRVLSEGEAEVRAGERQPWSEAERARAGAESLCLAHRREDSRRCANRHNAFFLADSMLRPRRPSGLAVWHPVCITSRTASEPAHGGLPRRIERFRLSVPITCC